MTTGNRKKEIYLNVLLSLYFVVGFFEIIAEFFNEIWLMYILKPLLIPLLASVYWIKSKERNTYFIAALFFVLLANIFFISKDFNSIVIASVFFIIYRALITYVVITKVQIKSFLPVFLGTIPFLAAYVYLAFLTKEELGVGFPIYVIQILILSFLGGLALSNFIIEDSKRNFWLLVHTILFAIIQFILVVKLYYISIAIFQPFSMVLYIVGQYAIYRFMIYTEKKKKIKL